MFFLVKTISNKQRYLLALAVCVLISLLLIGLATHELIQSVLESVIPTDQNMILRTIGNPMISAYFGCVLLSVYTVSRSRLIWSVAVSSLLVFGISMNAFNTIEPYVGLFGTEVISAIVSAGLGLVVYSYIKRLESLLTYREITSLL